MKYDGYISHQRSRCQNPGHLSDTDGLLTFSDLERYFKLVLKNASICAKGILPAALSYRST
jgi:hypothetical protein